jgi:predicted phosphodiesterase
MAGDGFRWREHPELLRQVQQLRSDGKTAREIGTELGFSTTQINGLFNAKGWLKDSPIITGATADDALVDVDELMHRLEIVENRASELLHKRENQSITFHELPVGIAVVSDQHVGGPATYRQMFADAELIRDSGLWCFAAGDLLNNWASNPRLARLQAGEWLNQAESRAIYHRYLDTIGDKLLAVVAGNHDRWSNAVGYDYIRDSLRGKPVLYDTGQVDVTLDADGLETRVRLRHTFRGKSMYNPTHGIENSCRLDGGCFDIGICGHSHAASLARPFVVGGEERLAVLVSSYKIMDDFATEHGFPKSHGSGSAAFVIDREGRRFGFGDIRQAADFLDALR